MNQELKFLEQLRELQTMVSTEKKDMTDEEIRAYFGNDQLDGAQLQMIRDYIKEDNKDEDELSEEDVEYLKDCEEMYASVPKLNTEDLTLYEKLVTGDRQAYETLAAAYMPRVLDAARAHKTEGIFIGDLVSEGLIGLTEGLMTVSGAASAHETIMASIRKSIRLFLMETEAEKSHDNSLIDKVRKMDEALTALNEDLGRKAYIEEVADYMGISEEEVWDILKLTGEDVSEEDEK